MVKSRFSYAVTRQGNGGRNGWRRHSGAASIAAFRGAYVEPQTVSM